MNWHTRAYQKFLLSDIIINREFVSYNYVITGVNLREKEHNLHIGTAVGNYDSSMQQRKRYQKR